MFSSYYEQLNGLDEVKKRNFINNLLPMISENLVVNPEAWGKTQPVTEERVWLICLGGWKQ